jgi:hypothetical protein
MPHSPDTKILDPEAALEASRDLIDMACPLLRELVNVSTEVCGIAFASPRKDELSGFPLLSCFLHVVEMTDGLEVLLRESCAWPGAPLCRSIFEALISFEYIAGDDAEQRSASWWVASTHGNLDYIERLDPRTARGRDFLEQVAADKTLDGWGDASTGRIDLHRLSTARFLEREEYTAAEEEYRRLGGTRKWQGKSVPWHALFNGPSNIRELARCVKRGGQYEILYRQWSEIVHPANLTRWVSFAYRGAPMARRIRDPKVFSHIALCAANMLGEANAAVLDWFAPDQIEAAVLEEPYFEMYQRLKAQG